MRPFLLWMFVCSSVLISANGCLPRTTVRQNPGRFDRGVRYYRPKPYLFVKPMLSRDGLPVDGYVSLEQVTLPDFSEEYSIHVRSGLGTNDTKITLNDGWNLTSLNVNIDSQFDENVKAAAEVIKAIPSLTATKQDGPNMAVRALNVPLGLYEAVISEGSDSKKRLYGFRYVGFMPYAPCPIESHGEQQQTCCDGQIFGLVFEDGAMVFKPLQETPFHVNTKRTEYKAGAAPELLEDAAIEPSALTPTRPVSISASPHSP